MTPGESRGERVISRRAALRVGSVSAIGASAGCLRPLLESDSGNESTTDGADGNVSSSTADRAVTAEWEQFYENPGPLTVDDGAVIVSDTDESGPAVIAGHEFDSGDRTWEFSTDDDVDQWAVATGHGNVYATATVGGTIHRTYVLERGSGRLATTIDIEVPGSTDDSIYDPLPAVVTSDRAIVGTGRWGSDGVATRVQAIDGSRMEATWTAERGSRLYRGGISYEGRAYLAADSGLVRVDLESESMTTVADSIWPSPNSRPVQHEDTVYILGRSSDGDRMLYGLSLPDGERRWSYNTETETFSSLEYAGPTTFTDGGAVVPVLDTMYAIDEDGTERWSTSIDEPVGRRPVVVDETAVLLGDDGLVGYDTETGETLFEHETVSEPRAAATDGERLVCSLDGSITRFEIEYE